ncbi:MAG: hypothetical protein AB7V19_06425 [Candidatus Bipolaricaulia bacterium]
MVKELVAVLVFLNVVALAIYLAVSRQADWKIVSGLLAFSLIAGFAIANYDAIGRVKALGVEIERARAEVGAAKDAALAQIEAEVIRQKEEISLLVAAANDARTRIQEQRDGIAALASSTAAAEVRVAELNRSSREIALLLTKVTWLTLETKSEFGTARATAAVNAIARDLNALIVEIIPNPEERSRWISEMQSALPDRR